MHQLADSSVSLLRSKAGRPQSPRSRHEAGTGGCPYLTHSSHHSSIRGRSVPLAAYPDESLRLAQRRCDGASSSRETQAEGAKTASAPPVSSTAPHRHTHSSHAGYHGPDQNKRSEGSSKHRPPAHSNDVCRRSITDKATHASVSTVQVSTWTVRGSTGGQRTLRYLRCSASCVRLLVR